MDFSVDGIHRALQRGIQAGLASGVVTWVLQKIGIISGCCPCSAFLLVTILSTAAAFYLDTLQIKIQGKAVLVTGCDSGFGHALSLRLERMGFVVFAGCLLEGGEGAAKLKAQGRKNLHVIQLDVTSEEEVKNAAEYIKKNLPPGARGLWGVVNNAGWSTFGDLEWVGLDYCKKMMNVNVWGMLTVIKAVLPLIRPEKGRVVNMASGLARMCIPGRSTYGISKYGVESLSDTMRYEMRRFGINVSIIEPGNFISATGIFTPGRVKQLAEDMWKNMSEEVRQAYGRIYFDDCVNTMIKYATAGSTDMTPVLDAMTNALVHRYPYPRYQPMDLYFKVRTLVATHLPEWVYEKLYV